MKRLIAAVFLVTGCGVGGGAAGVSGAVRFNGQPVPVGRVYFDPVPGANAGGVQGYADIINGRYDTSAGGRAPSPGPVTVRVDGFGPPAGGRNGPRLFVTYEVRDELPAGAATKDIEVPASAAAKLPKNPGEEP